MEKDFVLMAVSADMRIVSCCGKSGLEIIPQLREIKPDISVLIYTMFNDVIRAENLTITMK